MTKPHTVRAHVRRSPSKPKRSATFFTTTAKLIEETGFKPRKRVKARSRPVGRA